MLQSSLSCRVGVLVSSKACQTMHISISFMSNNLLGIDSICESPQLK